LVITAFVVVWVLIANSIERAAIKTDEAAAP
jgi:hypothetical protein